MVKFKEQNRGTMFLAGTLLAGILITSIVMLYENDDIEDIVIVNEAAKSNKQVLENKIENLNNSNFNPSVYSTLATEIEQSYKDDLITSSVKANLNASLKNIYSQLVFNQCDFFLTGTSQKSSEEILLLLRQVEGIISGSPNVDKYRSQINSYEYYSNKLPAIVENFIRGGVQTFVESKYLTYKSQLENMSDLEERYKNNPKLKQIRINLVSRLNQLYNQFSLPAPELDQESSDTIQG